MAASLLTISDGASGIFREALPFADQIHDNHAVDKFSAALAGARIRCPIFRALGLGRVSSSLRVGG